jgi:predicted MFS family arabinose efflux permease
MALVTAAWSFSLRGAIIPDLQKVFFDPFDAANATKLVGGATGSAFLGFAVSIFLGSPLCDSLGMGKLLALSCSLFVVGTIVTIVMPPSATVYWPLWVSFFIVGLGHGLVEAVINPLIATIYPDDKTHRLNVLHAWWPGGLVMGGLIATFLGGAKMDWKIQYAMILLPAIITGSMLIGTKFPPTERKAAGVSTGDMWSEALKPLFIILFFAMLLTASSELAPGQWVQSMLTRLVGFQGILLLVYVSGLMFVMRHFAGSLAHRLSPIGLMWISCLLASVGLYMLGSATSAVTGLVAATVWGVGVCYMWPTMLGITSERFPKGGAVLMGLMGCSGNIAIYFMLPYLGGVFDKAKQAAAIAAGTSFDAIKSLPETDPTMNKVLSQASLESFHTVAIFPAILLVVFGAWWLYDKAQGGYKAVKLQHADEQDLEPAVYE